MKIVIDKFKLAERLTITTDAAATILAKAAERKEIYGADFYGRCVYEVDEQWIEKITRGEA